MKKENPAECDYRLDITGDVCPMTFVKSRLLLERMSPGESAEILLRGEEPVRNVPESLAELGHVIVSLEPVGEANKDGAYRLVVRKKD